MGLKDQRLGVVGLWVLRSGFGIRLFTLWGRIQVEVQSPGCLESCKQAAV